MLHGEGPPPAAGWRDYLLEIRDLDLPSLGLLVFTSGGAPGAGQRQELNQVVNGRYFARAIVHDSAAVRGVVAAVSWFAPGVKAFSPGAWPVAAAHAKFEPSELLGLARSVRRLHTGMGERIHWLETALEQRVAPPPTAGLVTPPGRPRGSSKPPELGPEQGIARVITERGSANER